MVTFESDETEQEIRFSATHDTLNDDGESVVIEFGSSLPSRVTVTGGTQSSTTVTIGDDDNPTVTVNFEQTEYSVDEGAEVTVRVTLSANPERSVTIPITATGQDGATSNDYAIDPPSLTFASDERSKSLTFTATDDGVDDDGESVKLAIGSVAGVTLGGDSEATFTIVDDPDDVPAVTVSFARSSYTAAEDQTAANHTVEVTLTLSPAPEREVVIPIVRTNERNASDADYDPLPRTVTFASGDTLKSFTFTPVDDAIDDDGERVRLALGAPLPRLVSNGATAAATVSITDNDTRGVTVTPASLRIDEGDTGEYTVVLTSEPTADVTVTIDAPTNTDITVDSASLTFTSSNWSSPQRVEASGSEDPDDANDTGTITHGSHRRTGTTPAFGPTRSRSRCSTTRTRRSGWNSIGRPAPSRKAATGSASP